MFFRLQDERLEGQHSTEEALLKPGFAIVQL